MKYLPFFPTFLPYLHSIINRIVLVYVYLLGTFPILSNMPAFLLLPTLWSDSIMTHKELKMFIDKWVMSHTWPKTLLHLLWRSFNDQLDKYFTVPHDIVQPLQIWILHIRVKLYYFNVIPSIT